MAQSSARQVALAALRKWSPKRGQADAIVAELLADSDMPAVDRAFTVELFYGVLRNLTLLDFWIARLREGKVDCALRAILWLGLYQLLIANVPEHAAVYESVALASKRNRGLINAILRNAIRQRQDLESAARDQSLSIQTSHSDFLIERWQQQFGLDKTIALCEWNNRPPPIYARINRLKISDKEFSELYPNASPQSAVSGFVEFSGRFPSDVLGRGHCYVQDPSTRLAGDLLDPQPGETILDACAAPGGKTALIAQKMQNQGIIIATDRQAARLEILQANIDRLGVTIARCICHDWVSSSPTESVASFAPFDRILVDAPCSNTGVMRRRVDVRWRLQPDEFVKMQAEQMSILRTVFPLLKTNGTLVYSTCSLEPEENELLIQRLLNEMPSLRFAEEMNCVPFRDGFDGAYVARLFKTA